MFSELTNQEVSQPPVAHAKILVGPSDFIIETARNQGETGKLHLTASETQRREALRFL